MELECRHLASGTTESRRWLTDTIGEEMGEFGSGGVWVSAWLIRVSEPGWVS